MSGWIVAVTVLAEIYPVHICQDTSATTEGRQ